MKSLTLLVLSAALLLPPAAASALEDAHLSHALDRLEGDLESSAPFTCATTDILDLRAAWPELDPADRERFNTVIGGGGDQERGGGMPCFQMLPNVVESDHFTVQWGNGASLSDSAANHLLDALEDARQKYLDAGYAEPFGNPDIKVPFYLANSGSGAPGIDFSGGYTTVCNSYQHAYVALSSIEVSDSTIDVGVHELFHAVQMGSPNPYGVDSFYWESTAVWAEDFVQPDLNIYAWFLPYYTNYTDLALDYETGSEVGFMHQYAMFIFPTYIDEYSPGGPQALVDVWNGADGDLETRLETSWTDQGFDTTFDREFGGFTAYSSVMDYEDQATYNSNRIQPWEVLDPGDEVEDETAPSRFGSHYYRFDPDDEDVDAGRTKIRVSFDGDGPSWVVALNRSTDGNTALPTVAISDAEGLVEIEAIDVGTWYEEAWVVVTCSRSSCNPYDLTIEAVDQTEDPGSDLDPGDDDDDDDGRPQGLDCSGLGYHPFAYRLAGVSLGLLLTPLLFLRRRR